jgi:hypothetical protein
MVEYPPSRFFVRGATAQKTPPVLVFRVEPEQRSLCTLSPYDVPMTVWQ